MSTGRQEIEGQSSALPVISPDTKDRIRADYNLDFFNQSKREGEPPATLLKQNAEDVFLEAFIDSRPFVNAVLDVLKKINTYTFTASQQIDRYILDAHTEGMALVLKTYQTEFGPELFKGLADLNEEDLENVKRVIQESTESAEDELSILEGVVSKPRISDQHVDLISLVNEVSKYESPYRNKFQEGAVAGFRVLATVWHKIAAKSESPNSSS